MADDPMSAAPPADEDHHLNHHNDNNNQNDNPIFPDDDLEDDVVSDSESDDDEEEEEEEPLEPLNGVVPDPDSSSDPDDVVLTNTTTAVTVAVPSSLTPPPPAPSSSTAVTVALPDPKRHVSAAVMTTTTPPERKPIDDSRRLFQRLWTDEDEIELLQGFLDYTASRGATASGHHHDTAAFYDQIKNKLQLEFNKNQLVEKLRRLKKKYRNVLSKMSSGKEFVFKSPHDQATFELSRKIWTNLSGSFRGSGGVSGGGGGGAVSAMEFDDDDQINANPNPGGYNPVTIAAATPPRPPNSSYVISHINLNTASPGGGGGGSSAGYDMMLPNSSGVVSGGGLAKLSTRKRPRVSAKVEDKFVKTEGGMISMNSNNASGGNNASVLNNCGNVGPNNVGVSSPLQGLVEETVRNCLSPVLKDLINTAVNGAAAIASPSGGGSPGFKGVGAVALNAVPLNFSGVNLGVGGPGNVDGGMDEKWRKQQILELEVYSKRLELVQEQIKQSLEELRSMES